MNVSATAKFIRISPRKARLVVDQVRGKTVVDAERILTFMDKKAAEPVMKLILSATANGVHNHKMDKENLMVKTISVDEGFTMKRFRARAFGRASMVRKRTSRIHVVLEEIAPTVVKEKKNVVKKVAEKVVPQKSAVKKVEAKKEKTTPKEIKETT